MNREDYVAIAARLFAVYIAIQTVLQIPTGVRALSHDDGMTWAGIYVVVLFASLSICAFLWFFPLTIARKLLPVMKEPRSDQAISAPIGLSLGLTLIGVWLLAHGAIDSIYWLALMVRAKQQPTAVGFVWAPDQIASMAATAFQLGAGAWLAFGNAGIRRFIYKFRYGGQ